MTQTFANSARQPGRKACPEDHGFTLIEVLVVVAIIALLIAILLPSLAKARDQARSTVCAANMKSCTQGALIGNLEEGMRKERISTNFGWAETALKVNKGETGIFTCPTDQDPKPIPALKMKILPDVAETGASGIFNRVTRGIDGQWLLDVQDSIEGNSFGGDAPDNERDIDLQFSYQPVEGAKTVAVRIHDKESSYAFGVLDYKGAGLWSNVDSDRSGSHRLPILWMSYGANAPAGLRSVKGNPLLLVENCKLGIFPIDFRDPTSNAIAYPADRLIAGSRDYAGIPLRFRHGGNGNMQLLKGSDYTGGSPVRGLQPDKIYAPKTRMNASFYDGHVENLHFSTLLPDRDTGEIKKFLWLGTRQDTTIFD